MADLRHGGNVWEGENPAKWLDFSANLRPEGTPDWVIHTMEKAISDTRFYPDRDMAAAREGLAAYLGVPPSCVLPTAGGAAAIDLAISLGKGSVYTYAHTFGEYAERAAIHRRHVHPWSGECTAGDTVMLCNPNNPTGRAISRKEMLAICQQTVAHGGELVVDEAFIDFCPQHSVRSDIQPGLMVVGSLTKTLCIPGVRLGYVCAAPEVIGELERRALTWSLNTFAAAVAAELPNHTHEMEADSRDNKNRREAFTRQLEALGAEVWPSQSNFLLVDFDRDMTMAAQQLKQAGILVRTCASFGLGPEFWRLAVKTETENEHLIKQLEAILHAR